MRFCLSCVRDHLRACLGPRSTPHFIAGFRRLNDLAFVRPSGHVETSRLISNPNANLWFGPRRVRNFTQFDDPVFFEFGEGFDDLGVGARDAVKRMGSYPRGVRWKDPGLCRIDLDQQGQAWGQG